MLISFCCTMAVALAVALLIWLFAWTCKHLQSNWFNKWSFLKTAVENVHFLMLGGILRALILFYYPITLFAIYQLALIKDCWLFIFLAVICIVFLSLGVMIFCGYKILQPLKRNELEEYKKPSYALLYGSLYSQYIEDSSFKLTRIWFFIFPITYDFLRALVIGLGQRSAIAQIIGLLITDIIFLILLITYKPFKRPLMSYLKIGVIVLQIVIVILLIPFIGNTPLLYRIIIEYVMKSLQFIITILLVTFAIVALSVVIRNFMKGNEEDKDDNRSLIKEEKM
ncbi:TRP-like family [Glomus cerebriforme]|uniref:TRP-like family n=1 Tax=Glomus cerebriforme TaxID=658196 RepID=A0A397TFH0_9GLOM|nr:TRP-like family [Glomus cerebriforme]